MDKRLIWAVIIAVFSLGTLFLAGSGATPLTAFAVSVPEPDVLILDSGFSPAEVVVSPGESVTWKNSMKNVAVLWSTSPDETFTSPIIRPGEVYSHVYNSAGSFRYVDVNFGFRGVVVVKPAAVSAEEQEQEQEQLVPPEPPEGRVVCAVCESGCRSRVGDCTLCDCPCYRDTDCDDRDPCTFDVCSSSPVKCVSRHSGGCSYGSSCLKVGERIAVGSTVSECTGRNLWARDISMDGLSVLFEPDRKSSFGLAALLLIIGACVLFVLVSRRKKGSGKNRHVSGHTLKK